MKQFFFVPYLLELLAQGAFFRRLFFYFFRAAATLAGVIGLVACAGFLRIVLNLPAFGVVGGFIFIALAVVAFYAVAHILWCRADNIRALSDSKFTMIPIYAIMVRSTGEVLAAFIAVMSVGGCILLLFAPQSAGGILGDVLPPSPLAQMMRGEGNSFLEALAVLIGGLIYAVLLLAIFYLVAEFISALAEIAISTNVTAINTGLLCSAGRTVPSVSAVALSAAAPPQSTPAAHAAPLHKTCAVCGTANHLSAAFCENCGSAL